MRFRATTLWESQGSPEEGYKLNDSGVVRRFQMADGLAARRQAAADFCGYSYFVTTPSSQPPYYIYRVTPHVYPIPATLVSAKIPNAVFQSNLYCTRVLRTQGRGAGSAEITNPVTRENVGKYARVEVSLQWQCLPFKVREDSECLAQAPVTANGADNPLYNAATPAMSSPDEGDCLRRGYGQFSRYVQRLILTRNRTIPARVGMFKFSDGTFNAGTPWLLREGINEITYKHFFVPEAAYPQRAIQLYGGCVSGLAFDGWPKGTLMYTGARYDFEFDVLGQVVYTVTHRFLHCSRIRRHTRDGISAGEFLGWNSAPRTYGDLTFDFDGLSTDGLNTLKNRPYRSFDPSRLFRPDQPGYAQDFMD